MSTKVMVVGCGGLAYHVLPQLRVLVGLLADEGRVSVLCVDDDTVTPENGLRQWPHAAGELKAELVAGTFEGIADAQELGARVAAEELVKLAEDDERVVVLGLPDNHEARAMCADAAQLMYEKEKEVYLVVAGNEMGKGFAWGNVGDTEEFRKRHRILFVKDERKPKEGAVSCAAAVVQTARTNALTSVCIAEVLERMLRTDEACEMEWTWAAGEGEVWKEATIRER